MRPGTPGFDLIAQHPIFLRKLLKLALQSLSNGCEGYAPGQFLFARLNVLPYYVGVDGISPKFEEPIKVVNGRGVILFILFTNQSRLEVRQRRARVCFDRFLEALQAALVIQ